MIGAAIWFSALLAGTMSLGVEEGASVLDIPSYLYNNHWAGQQTLPHQLVFPQQRLANVLQLDTQPSSATHSSQQQNLQSPGSYLHIPNLLTGPRLQFGTNSLTQPQVFPTTNQFNQQQYRPQHQFNQPNTLQSQNVLTPQQFNTFHVPTVPIMSQQQNPWLGLGTQNGYSLTSSYVQQPQQQKTQQQFRQQQQQQLIYPSKKNTPQNPAPMGIPSPILAPQRQSSQYTPTQPKKYSTNLIQQNVPTNVLRSKIGSHSSESNQLPLSSQSNAKTTRTEQSTDASTEIRSTVLKVASNIRQAIELASSLPENKNLKTPIGSTAKDTIVIPAFSASAHSVTISQDQLQKLSLIIAGVLKLQNPSSTSLPGTADVATAVNKSPILLSPLLAPPTITSSPSRPARSALDKSLGVGPLSETSTVDLSVSGNSNAGSSSLLSLLLAPFSSSTSPLAAWQNRNLLQTNTESITQEQQLGLKKPLVAKKFPEIANISAQSEGSGMNASITKGSPSNKLPIAPQNSPMQTLLDQVQRLQLEEQTQLAAKSRQLREEQDLLLAQQGASLEKQQKQLQNFQKHLQQQEQIFKQNIMNRMGTDMIRSIIREEIKGQAGANGLSMDASKSSAKSAQNIARPGPSNFQAIGVTGIGVGPVNSVPSGKPDDALDPLGLGGPGLQRMKLKAQRVNEIDMTSVSVPPRKVGKEFANNDSPIQVYPRPSSSVSSSSSSSSISSMPSPPSSLYSLLSSSASSSSSSSNILSSPALQIPNGDASTKSRSNLLTSRASRLPSSSSSFPLPTEMSQTSGTRASSSTSSSYPSPYRTSSVLDRTGSEPSIQPHSLSTRSRELSTETKSSANVAPGTKGIASSWAIVMQPENTRNSRNQLYSLGNRKSLRGSNSLPRSFLRDNSMNRKNNVYDNSNLQRLITRSRHNNPLGLNINQASRNNGMLSIREMQGGRRQSTYEINRTRPSYMGGSNTRRRGQNPLNDPSFLSSSDSLFSTPSFLYEGAERSTRRNNFSLSGGLNGLLSIPETRYISEPRQQDFRRRRQQHHSTRHQLRHHNLRQYEPEQQQESHQRLGHQRMTLDSSRQRQRSQQQFQDQRRQHQDRLISSRSQIPNQGRQQEQNGSRNRQRAGQRSGFTKHQVDGIEVRATPARRTSPNGPLRIGLDINVRHGVYPIESFKQS